MPTVAGKRRLNATPAGGQRRHGRHRQRVMRRAIPDPHLDLDEHHEHCGDRTVDPQRVGPGAACEGERSKHFVKSRPRKAGVSSAARLIPEALEIGRPAQNKIARLPDDSRACPA